MTERKKDPIRIDFSDGDIGLCIGEKHFWKLKEDGHIKNNVYKLAELFESRKKEQEKLGNNATEIQVLKTHEEYAKNVLALIIPDLDFEKESNNKEIGLGALIVASGAIYNFLVVNAGPLSLQYQE